MRKLQLANNMYMRQYDTSAIAAHKFIVFCADHYNPLGVIRSLGEEGIRPIVIVVARKPFLVNHSKYISKCHVVQTMEEGLKVLMDNYGKEELKPFLYTCSDDIESFLDIHYDELYKSFYFFNGGCAGCINAVMNKEKMMSLAESCGLDVPKHKVVAVGCINHGLRYPIMTKSVDSLADNWKKNVFICRDESDLIGAYKNIEGDNIILQEYIEKKNELCLDGLCVNGGTELFIPLQTSYIRMTDKGYGNYMKLSEFKNNELLLQLRRLFSLTKFTGIFSVEFLVDKDDNLHFLEINFRNSTWSYAFTCCGANLPVIWAQSELNGRLNLDSFSLNRTECIAMAEIADFKDSVVHGNTGVLKWIKNFMTADCTFYFNKNDIKPALYKLLQPILF